MFVFLVSACVVFCFVCLWFCVLLGRRRFVDAGAPAPGGAQDDQEVPPPGPPAAAAGGVQDGQAALPAGPPVAPGGGGAGPPPNAPALGAGGGAVVNRRHSTRLQRAPTQWYVVGARNAVLPKVRTYNLSVLSKNSTKRQ